MEKVILGEKEIQAIASRLGERISRDYAHNEKPPVLLCVMNGAMNFAADLMKHITIDVIFDYVQVKSWEGTKSTGKIEMVKDVFVNIADRDVLIVEDIIDSGASMHFLIHYLKEKYQPRSVKVCALFDKPSGRKIQIEADYTGFVLEGNEFLVGYGLDYKGLVRNVPFVYVPSKDEIANWDKETED